LDDEDEDDDKPNNNINTCIICIWDLETQKSINITVTNWPRSDDLGSWETKVDNIPRGLNLQYGIVAVSSTY